MLLLYEQNKREALELRLLRKESFSSVQKLLVPNNVTGCMRRTCVIEVSSPLKDSERSSSASGIFSRSRLFLAFVLSRRIADGSNVFNLSTVWFMNACT